MPNPIAPPSTDLATSGASDVSGGALTTPSVLRIINRCNAKLEALLPNLGNKVDANLALTDIAEHLIRALELNSDIALATIFLNQIAGTYAVRHCIETAIVALLIGKANQQSHAALQTLACAALTMNIGMLGLHEQMQNQSLLSSDEQTAIFQHPEVGTRLLQQAGIDDPQWLDYVATHHENPDGSGYPQGKSGDQIAPNARLLALADRYCAQVSARNYRKSQSPVQALQSLKAECHESANLIQLFQQEIGPYPPGSFVLLANGEIGVVTTRAKATQNATSNATSNATPIVSALIGPTGIPYLPNPIARDCANAFFQIQSSLHEDEADIRFSMKQIWGIQASL